MSRVAANLNTFSPENLAHQGQGVACPVFDKRSHIVVVGAGAFGSWTSLYLLRSGFKVTLVDAWGPAHARSSSSDETRVIRSTYGGNEVYFDLNVRALTLWQENGKNFGRQLFHNTGVLWFCYEENTPLVDDSMVFAKKYGMEYEYFKPDELQKRNPNIRVSDLHHAYFDPFGGYLDARESIQTVCHAFIKEGGAYVQAYVQPGKISHERLQEITLSNADHLKADGYVFACGAWLGKLFPDFLHDVITCTKQEVYYFGVPAEHSLAFENIPVWVDVDGKDFYYGIPGNGHRGFKIGVDVRGAPFDPTSGEHVYTPETLVDARKFIAHRFPLLKNAPLVESRVCPYENSPDGNFIFTQIPDTINAFVLGGGSGHGFKHGPALGELISQAFCGKATIPALFQKDFRKRE